MLGAGIARMDGGKFYRNAVAVVHAGAAGIFADGVYGVDVILVIAFGVGLGHCRFAEHIEGIAVAEFFALFTVFQCFFDGLAGN